MNKFCQWLQSIKSTFAGPSLPRNAEASDPVPPGKPVMPREDLDAPRERIIENVFPIPVRPLNSIFQTGVVPDAICYYTNEVQP
jgi:hypothetical protein